MIDHAAFLKIIDAYKAAAQISSDGALSSRMFNDGKKIAALREDGDITLRRLIHAMDWLASNWPESEPVPELIASFSARPSAEAS